MAAEILAPIVELALYAAVMVAEISVYVVVASIRPWRYVLSSSYRQQVDAQYTNKHPLFKWLAITGGAILLAASAIVIYGAVKLYMSTHESSAKPPHTLKELAVSGAASAAVHWAKSKASSAQ